MDLQLTDKTALVTGSTAGIGLEILSPRNMASMRSRSQDSSASRHSSASVSSVTRFLE